MTPSPQTSGPGAVLAGTARVVPGSASAGVAQAGARFLLGEDIG
jgi:hypothetical protein